jgi:hypothetical protein
MKKSPSAGLLTDSIDSFSMLGADLTHYNEELARERNARTLTLRRRDGTSSSAFGATPVSRAHHPLINLAKYPYFDPEKAIATLGSGDESKIAELAAQIVSAAPSNRLLTSLVRSTGFLEALSACLTNPYPIPLLVSLLDAIRTIFPHCGQFTQVLVDGGMTFPLVDFLQSAQPALVEATLNLLALLCEKSSYARDSILCLEIHSTLIQIALQKREITDKCCACVLAVFSNREPVEPEVLIGAVGPLFEILSIGSPRAIAAVLDCFVAMSNQHSALVHSLYDLGLFERVVGFLGTPGLVGPSLRLIGNMSVAQPFQLKTMLDAGLVGKLMEFLESEHAADAFWVLSNLMEEVSGLITPFVTEEFVERLLEIMDTSSYDIQKECAFFLSTLILFAPDAETPRFMVTPIIEMLVSMVGCGVEKVMLRCIDTLLKFLRNLQGRPNPEILQCLNDSDLKDRLDELMDQDQEQPLLLECAEALAKQLQDIQATAP